MSLRIENLCPDGSGEISGKFVIARRAWAGSDDVIVFSSYAQDTQHVEVVRRWERVNAVRMSDVGLTPSGGGMWRLLDGGKTLCLHGSSQAFGGFDKDSLLRELGGNKVFAEDAILFDSKYDTTV